MLVEGTPNIFTGYGRMIEEHAIVLILDLPCQKKRVRGPNAV